MTGVCRGGFKYNYKYEYVVGGLFAGLWSVEYVGEKLQGHNVLSEGKEEEEVKR